MKRFYFTQQQWLPRSIDEVFGFFSDAHNLERLTPSWLKFKVLTPDPIELKTGTLIDYQLRIRGIPLQWQSEITAWKPPYYFVDEQRRGPYKLWIHEHQFEESAGGVSATDRVEYAVLGGAIINRLFISRDIERIFQFRKEMLEKIFAGPDSTS